MKELPPDPPWWVPKLRWTFPVIVAIRRSAQREARMRRGQIVRRAFGGPSRGIEPIGTVAASLLAIQFIRWIVAPRSRVVWRARVSPGDRLQITAVRGRAPRQP
jgi:hypothetical protein